MIQKLKSAIWNLKSSI